jgi:hypothetical protein
MLPILIGPLRGAAANFERPAFMIDAGHSNLKQVKRYLGFDSALGSLNCIAALPTFAKKHS